MWCKPGQYLDYKKCVCKNKLSGRVIAECTNIINETMMNNRDNIVFFVFAYFKWIKSKKLFKNKYTNY